MNDEQRRLISYFNSLPNPTPPESTPGADQGVPLGGPQAPKPPTTSTPETVQDRLQQQRAMDAFRSAEAADFAVPGGGEELAPTPSPAAPPWPDGVPPWTPPVQQPLTDRVIEVAGTAAARARNQEDLDPEQAYIIEHIVIPGQLRPVIDIINGDFATPPITYQYLDTYRSMIRNILPSIGRIDAPGLWPRPYAGTGFVVGEGLLLTNRHVAALFVDGVGLGSPPLSLRTGLGTCLDPQYEVGDPDPGSGDVRFEVVEALLVHPHWDAALLRIRSVDGAELPKPLSLARQPPPMFGGGAMPQVVVIGYPAFDETVPASIPAQINIFRQIFQRKRLAPGFLRGYAGVPSKWGRTVRAIMHDSTTLNGSSGSAVVDLTSGVVVGLHYGGRYLDANYAVPTWELARDTRVTDLNLNFSGPEVSPAGATEWDDAWAALGAQGSQG